MSTNQVDDDMSPQKAKSPPPGRPGKLELPQQKEFVDDIVYLGGLSGLKYQKLVDYKYIYDTSTSIGNAFRNKYNYLKTNPSAYEKLQVQLFGRVVDNSFLDKKNQSTTSTPVSETTPSDSTKPATRASSTPKPKSTPTPKPTSATPTSILQSTPTPTSTIVPDDLFKRFGAMNINERFGNVPFDDTITVDLSKGTYIGHDLVIFSTPNRVVSEQPVLSTDVVTFLLTNTDRRWKESLPVKFRPFRFTQVGVNEFVLEKPKASYDFFFAPRLDKQNDGNYQFNMTEIDDAFIVSEDDEEMKVYERARASLLDFKNKYPPQTSWYKRTKIVITGRVLDYQLLDADKRQGRIKSNWTFGVNAEIKWRVAVVPEHDEAYIHGGVEEEDDYAAEFAKAEERRKAALNAVKAAMAMNGM